MNKIQTIVICGPTASGKTALSLALAEYFGTGIISADSRQVYKLLDIGTAKPTTEELRRAPHHFIDFLDVDEEYNAGRFGNEAYDKLLEIAGHNKFPIVVGGSGLYIKSLCEGLFEEEESEVKNEIRKELDEELKERGLDALYNELASIDKDSYLLYKEKNPRRILRALEYYRTTGKVFSAVHKELSVERNVNPIYLLIDFPREVLYERINMRTYKMWESGLVEEVEKILNLGYSKELNSLNTVGYKETIKFLENIYSQDEAIAEIQKNTRRYAKRQLTWCRKIQNVHYIQASSGFDAVIENAIKIVSDFIRS